MNIITLIQLLIFSQMSLLRIPRVHYWLTRQDTHLSLILWIG